MTIYFDGVLQSTGFTISGVGNNGGGDVTFSIAPTSAVEVYIRRSTALDRQTDYNEGDAIRPETLDADLDRLVHMVQNTVNASVYVDGDGKINANNRVIKNVGTPVNANDVVNKTFADGVLSTASGYATSASNSVTAAAVQVGLATTQTGLATTQAGIATAQAVIATTQAGISTTQAGLAAAYAASINLPSSFTGAATRMLRVNDTETGYEFQTVAQVLTNIGAEPANAAIVKTNVSSTFTKSQTASAGTLTDGVTIDWDAQNVQVATVTLGGNRTVNAPTNVVSGTAYILIVKQDGTGGRSLAWNSVFKFMSGVAPTLTVTASAVDVFTFVADGSNLRNTGSSVDVR